MSRLHKVRTLTNATPVTNRPAAKPKKGYVYLSNNGFRWEVPEYTPELLQKYSESYYGSSLILKLTNLIVPGAPEIKCINGNGNEEELISKDLQRIAESQNVRLFEAMRFAFLDWCWAGFYVINDVWDYEGSAYTLQGLYRLPPETFNESCSTSSYIDPIFRGILIEDDKVKLFQTNDSQTIEVTGCTFNRAPLSRNIAGTALLKPLIPTIQYLQTCWQATMQTVDRTGAPWGFIVLGENYTDDDEKYAQKVLKGWGKDTMFTLTPNITWQSPGLPEPKTPAEAINLLMSMLKDYFSPADFIQNDSAALSTSDISAGKLFNKWIMGMQNFLEEGFERMLQSYCEGNLYTDCHVEITLPRPLDDQTELMLKVLDGFNKSGIAKIEEMRALFPDRLKEMTPEEMSAFQEEKKARQPVQANPFQQQQTQPEMVGNARIVQMLQESLKV